MLTLTLPSEYLTLIAAFAPVFSARVWRQVRILLIGAILAPGKRTVTSVLQVMGLSQTQHFQNYHQVLNRAVQSRLELGRLWLRLLVTTVAAPAVVLLGLNLLSHVFENNILHRTRADKRLTGTRVIIATGYPELAETVSHEADAVLIKPVDVDKLSDLIARLYPRDRSN